MYKKILSWLLTVIMIFSMFGGIGLEGFGISDPECKIDETEYLLFADALTASVDGDTITLLKNVNHTGKITITGNKITFNLNGFNLNLSNTGDTTVEVSSGGEIDLVGEGEFNVVGTNLGTTGYYDLRGTVTIKNGGKITVTNVTSTGNSGYPAYGIYVSDGAATVLNNVETSGTKRLGIFATGINSSAVVYNNVKSLNSAAVQLYDNSNITVYGNVEGVYGVDANNSTVLVKGDAVGVSAGARALSGAQVYIGGNTTSSGNNSYGAYSTQENSFISVSGSAISYGDYSRGTFAGAGAEALIIGNSESRGNDGDGVYTTYNSNVRIKGNVISESGTGVWAWHNLENKPSVTIDGEIVAETFIEFGSSPTTYNIDNYFTPTTKVGYFTYTDGNSTVWVSYPAVWGIEIESTDMYPFAGGDGSSEETAYEISTANQLAQLAYNVNNGNKYTDKYFKLSGDINLSGKEWVPIGNIEANYFNGFFDGNNNCIEGLTIGSTTDFNSSYYASGLFGVIGSNSLIENLKVLDSTIYSNTTMGTGMLAGYNNGGNINHCGTSGEITSYSSIGGLVGRNAGSIYNSYSDVDLTSDRNSIGGFVGYNDSGNIYNCYATGDVVGGAYSHAGGFIGYTVSWSGTSIIENSYATGNVSGSAWGYLGGFYGRSYQGTSFMNTYWNADAEIIASEYHGYTPSVHGSNENGLANPSATMKSETFVTQLNNNLPEPKTDYYKWIIDTRKNQGYPIHNSIFTIAPEEPSPSPRPSLPSLEIETTTLKDGIEGEEYKVELKAEGGISPYSWSAEGLPSGLSINKGGLISGTSEENGSFSVKIELMDSRNYYRSKIFDLLIEGVKDDENNEDTESEEASFIDIKDHWSKDYIKEVVSKNIIKGYPDGTFKPENKITREEFASILIRALGLQTETGMSFADTLNRWSTDSISTAVYYNIIAGYNENTFGPSDPITREQMAVMIARALKLDGQDEETTLRDVNQSSSWAKASIIAAVKEGLLDGYPDGTFRAKNNLTRAEAIKVIFNLLNNLENSN